MNIENIKLPHPDYISLKDNQICENTNSKLWFFCPICGVEKLIVLKSVLNSYTKTCGCGCLKKKKEPWKPWKPLTTDEWIKIFDNKVMKPKNFDDLNGKSISSSHKIIMICGCGNEFTGKIGKITNGQKKSCGKCNMVFNPQDIKYGNGFVYIDSNEPLLSTSHNKKRFICSCGNEFLAPYSLIYNNKRKTCGKCNKLKYEDHIGKKINNLTILEINKERHYRKDGKGGTSLKCKCVCGNIINMEAAQLFGGTRTNCGMCLPILKKYRKDNPMPVNINLVADWLKNQTVHPLEPLTTFSKKTKFLCDFCDREFATSLSDMKRGKIFSCGCLTGKISKPVIEIKEFLDENDIPIKFEHYIGKNYFLDLYSDEFKIGIEFNGLRYHTNTKSKIKEFKKMELCKQQDIELIIIFEDEWTFKSNIIKNILLNKFNKTKPISIRPKNCHIKMCKNSENKFLLDSYHIQGNRNSKINIGAFHDNKLIATISLDKPSRQNSGDYEISRMCADPKYKIHGIWSKFLNFIKQNSIISGKLYTFSDNRFSNGNVYKNMGFVLEKEIKQDYYWAKGRYRYHKSKMRKNDLIKSLNLTESEYWIQQGYNKIWDMGKKKWIINI